MKPWPTVRLGEVLTHFTKYIGKRSPISVRDQEAVLTIDKVWVASI